MKNDADMRQSGDVMMYLVTDVFTDERHWASIDMSDMKVVGPAILGEGSYRAVSGRVFKIDDKGSVIDDTEAWKRAEQL